MEPTSYVKPTKELAIKLEDYTVSYMLWGWLAITGAGRKKDWPMYSKYKHLMTRRYCPPLCVYHVKDCTECVLSDMGSKSNNLYISTACRKVDHPYQLWRDAATQAERKPYAKQIADAIKTEINRILNNKSSKEIQALTATWYLWNWLSANPGNSKEDWFGWRVIKECDSSCPLCECYANSCIICPLGENLETRCENDDSPYRIWRCGCSQNERVEAAQTIVSIVENRLDFLVKTFTHVRTNPCKTLPKRDSRGRFISAKRLDEVPLADKAKCVNYNEKEPEVRIILHSRDKSDDIQVVTVCIPAVALKGISGLFRFYRETVHVVEHMHLSIYNFTTVTSDSYENRFTFEVAGCAGEGIISKMKELKKYIIEQLKQKDKHVILPETII